METQYPKYRWFVCAVMVVGTVAQGICLIGPSPIVNLVDGAGNPIGIAAQLGLSVGQATGLLMVAFQGFVVVGGIVGGILADRIEMPKLYLLSLILVIAGAAILFAAGDSVALAVVGRAIQGLGSGPMIASLARLLALWFPSKEKGIVAGIQGAALSLGIALGLSIVPQLFYALGNNWNMALAIPGILAAVALVLTIIWNFGPKPPVQVQEQIKVESGAVSAGDMFKLAAKTPVFYACIIVSVCASWIQQAYNDLTPGNLAGPPAEVIAANNLEGVAAGLNYGGVGSGMAMGALSIAFLVGSLVSGFFFNFVFKQKARVMLPVCFVITAAFCASVLFFNPFEGNAGDTGVPIPGTLLVCLIIAGFFMGMPNATTQGYIANNFPVQITGKVGSLAMSIGIAGSVLGVVVGSMALHVTNAYNVSVVIVSVVGVIGAIVASIALKGEAAFKAQQSAEVE
ncbi:MAG: MFS transporter [Clostridiales Family XIII bacterium]|nr:MFS transporter [Clostridiales Family XIII bacterium]